MCKKIEKKSLKGIEELRNLIKEKDNEIFDLK